MPALFASVSYISFDASVVIAVSAAQTCQPPILSAVNAYPTTHNIQVILWELKSLVIFLICHIITELMDPFEYSISLPWPGSTESPHSPATSLCPTYHSTQRTKDLYAASPSYVATPIGKAVIAQW